jgi:hypothetical protein
MFFNVKKCLIFSSTILKIEGKTDNSSENIYLNLVWVIYIFDIFSLFYKLRTFDNDN